MKRDDRRAQIIEAGLTQARIADYWNVDRSAICREAGCVPGLINHYFGTISQLRRAIMGEAIRRGDLTIIAQGIMHRDPRVANLDPALKQRAVESLLYSTPVL